MAWKVELTPEAKRALDSLGKTDARRILKFLFDRPQHRENPRELGIPLKGRLHEFWRYRVGDYRIVCLLDDGRVTVIVVHVGHRSTVYKTKN